MYYVSPHRLVAQDGALSRLKQGFESPWGHKRVTISGSFFLQTGTPIEGMLFEYPRDTEVHHQ